MRGTSSRAPAHISGLAALIRPLSPSLALSDLLALIERTADPETGLINACRAVEVVRRADGAQPIGEGLCELARVTAEGGS